MTHSSKASVRRSFTLIALVTTLLVASMLPARAESAIYVALGDSYSAGVGTREYIDDGSGCQRSTYAYPSLSAQSLAAELVFAACSGARVNDVIDSQLGLLTADASYVSIQVGGNDAGFADVILACAGPWPTTCWDEIDAANAYIEQTLPGTLDDLYDRVSAAAPAARIVVVGYPRLFNGEECNLASRISPGEQAELNATADLLSTTIQSRATESGFAYVDARDAFLGHSVCDDAEWINGLSNPIGESYHPNRDGQAGYTEIVEPILRG